MAEQGFPKIKSMTTDQKILDAWAAQIEFKKKFIKQVEKDIAAIALMI